MQSQQTAKSTYLFIVLHPVDMDRIGERQPTNQLPIHLSPPHFPSTPPFPPFSETHHTATYLPRPPPCVGVSSRRRVQKRGSGLPPPVQGCSEDGRGGVGPEVSADVDVLVCVVWEEGCVSIWVGWTGCVWKRPVAMHCIYVCVPKNQKHAPMMRMSSGCSVSAAVAPIICASMPGTPLCVWWSESSRVERVED